MSALINLIERLANWRAILILIVLSALVFMGINMSMAELSQVSGGYGILDFDMGYSKERVMQVLGSYGDKGMQLNARIQVLDLFNPALYSLIAATLTYLVWRWHGPIWMALIAFLPGIGDYLENITLFMMSKLYPNIPDGLVTLSSTLSLLKHGLMMTCYLPLLVGLILWGYRKVGT